MMNKEIRDMFKGSITASHDADHVTYYPKADSFDYKDNIYGATQNDLQGKSLLVGSFDCDNFQIRCFGAKAISVYNPKEHGGSGPVIWGDYDLYITDPYADVYIYVYAIYE